MSLAAWRDLSIVLLVLETFVFVLVIAAVLYLTNRGIAKAHQALRRFAPQAQGFFHMIAMQSERISQKITAPMISAEAKAAQVRRWMSFLRSPTR